ncbi:MAG: FimB/Mfa2 family fimbrial subunit [Rikenellaceae bacterium]|nr:FimB/Mfa2 family fimbrial subunit [Rikenellaceae bacterium]
MRILKRHILPLLAVLIWTGAVSGCSKSKDECPRSGEKEEVDVLLRVKFSFAYTRATDQGTAYERRVKDLRIYVFEDDGSLELMLTFDESQLTGDLFETSAVILAGDKTFVLVANEPDHLSAGLDAVEKLSDMAGMQLTAMPDQYPDGLPFVTTEKVEVVKIEDQVFELDLALRRAVAKTELCLIKSEDNYTTVRVAQIDIIDTPTRSNLLPDAPLSDNSLLTTVTDVTGSAPLTVDESTDIAHYLYERITGEGDAEANRATRLTLVLDIDGVNYSYPLSLATLDGQGRTVNDIVRNTLYRMNIEVYPYSIYVTHTVWEWDWDEENEYEVELGGGKENGSLYTVKEWIEGETWDVELPTGN